MKKIFLIILILSIGIKSFASEEEFYLRKPKEKPDIVNKKGKEEDPGVVGKKKPPLPRFVVFPKVFYDTEPSKGGQFEIDFSRRNYWFVVFTSTWSAKSQRVVQTFQNDYPKLTRRHIGVVCLFTADTQKSLEKWRETHKLPFLSGFASEVLIEKLNNPKVPTFYFIDRKRRMLRQAVMPDIAKTKQALQRAYHLTDF